MRLDMVQHEAYLESLSVADRATLLSEMLPGASGFLEAIPSKHLDFAWDPCEFLVELRTRLLADVYDNEDWCPVCEGVSDCKGHHARKCAGGGDRVRRHNGVRNLIGQFASEAKQRPTLEKPGLLQPRPGQISAQLRRPADVYLPSWQGGQAAALDVAITSPQRLDIRTEASTRMGAAAAAYEVTKREYLGTAADCQSNGIAFIPMIAETSGGWGVSGICTLKALARTVAAQTNQTPQRVLSEQLQFLGTAIRRANARAVLRRDVAPVNLGTSAAASAAAALVNQDD